MSRFLPPITGNDLSVETVAIEMDCSEKTVRRLAARGKLLGYKVGRVWRFKRAALEAFRRPITPFTPPPPTARVSARRGGVLAGWHDFD